MKHLQQPDWKSDLLFFSYGYIGAISMNKLGAIVRHAYRVVLGPFLMFPNFERLELTNVNIVCCIISKSMMKHLQQPDWKSDLLFFSYGYIGAISMNKLGAIVRHAYRVVLGPFLMFPNFERLELTNVNIVCCIISKSMMKHLQQLDWRSDLPLFSYGYIGSVWLLIP